MNKNYYILLFSVTISSVGCQSVYYKSIEALGFEKREIMVDRVEDVRDSQEEAKETFADALEAFSTLTDYNGGELEAAYKKLNDAYKDSLSAAKDVSGRIDKVESVAGALFEEWEQELEAYSSDSLRRSSERSLRDTRARYDVMLRKMRVAEASMEPVIELFEDQVLYLKHNLNARAIAALDMEVGQIEERVRTLVQEMEASIDEANDFISQL